MLGLRVIPLGLQPLGYFRSRLPWILIVIVQNCAQRGVRSLKKKRWSNSQTVVEKGLRLYPADILKFFLRSIKPCRTLNDPVESCQKFWYLFSPVQGTLFLNHSHEKLYYPKHKRTMLNKSPCWHFFCFMWSILPRRISLDLNSGANFKPNSKKNSGYESRALWDRFMKKPDAINLVLLSLLIFDYCNTAKQKLCLKNIYIYVSHNANKVKFCYIVRSIKWH
jgi:hypothetical protein